MEMETLRQARLRNDLTQTELARITGLTFVSISHIERGKYKPHKSTMEKIEKALDEKIDWKKTFINGIIRSSKREKDVLNY